MKAWEEPGVFLHHDTVLCALVYKYGLSSWEVLSTSVTWEHGDPPLTPCAPGIGNSKCLELVFKVFPGL